MEMFYGALPSRAESVSLSALPRVCAWCVSDGDCDDHPNATHGICPRHAAEVRAKTWTCALSQERREKAILLAARARALTLGVTLKDASHATSE